MNRDLEKERQQLAAVVVDQIEEVGATRELIAELRRRCFGNHVWESVRVTFPIMPAIAQLPVVDIGPPQPIQYDELRVELLVCARCVTQRIARSERVRCST